MNKITDTVSTHWNRRQINVSQKGWHMANAVCCIHNNETLDKKGRGGFIYSGGGVVWNCFNCGFKAGWKPGWSLGFKMRDLLSWIGVDESTVKLLVFEALRLREEIGYEETHEKEEIKIEFAPKALPEDAKTIQQWLNWYAMGSDPDDYSNVPNDLCEVIGYCDNRLNDTDLETKYYWTPNTDIKMNRRLIIPFTWEGKIIGYTARHIDDPKVLKYYNQYAANFVYGIDNQKDTSQFALVMEGPLDAIVVNGLAVLSNDISGTQADIIANLNKEIIVVPDRGEPGQKLIDCALKYNWSVSLPDWIDDDVDDVNKAVQCYGKLFVLQQILKSKITSPLKIELLRKTYV